MFNVGSAPSFTRPHIVVSIRINWDCFGPFGYTFPVIIMKIIQIIIIVIFLWLLLYFDITTWIPNKERYISLYISPKPVLRLANATFSRQQAKANLIGWWCRQCLSPANQIAYNSREEICPMENRLNIFISANVGQSRIILNRQQ